MKRFFFHLCAPRCRRSVRYALRERTTGISGCSEACAGYCEGPSCPEREGVDRADQRSIGGHLLRERAKSEEAMVTPSIGSAFHRVI